MKYGQFLLLSLAILCSPLSAQKKDSIALSLQPIVITAFRTPIQALYTNRSLNIIDERVIQNSGAVCIEELLQKEANLHIQPRGILGVQSDVSIRGAAFSQQLILLNSVRMNDAQTAHHNFDLPVSMDQIERIEVLQGAGSALYGPDAYGGVINIITKIPDEQALRMKLSGGENGFMSASAGFDFSSSGIHSSNMIEHRRSDGYHEDTDFQISIVASNNSIELPWGTYSIFGGYIQKAFGAFNFYGPSPSKEWTETAFFNTATKISFPSVLLQPKISYRRHYDKFMYDLHSPQNVNINTTHSYSGELQSVIQIHESSSLITAIEGIRDDIISSNLRNHTRSSLGILATVHGIIHKNILVDVGVRQDFHSAYGDQCNPAASVGYLFSESTKIFISSGRSFRAPSYTELYYSSRQRVGNENLKPETGWSYELGLNYTIHPQIKVTTSLFERDQENLIDYVQYTTADTVFHATNFTKAITRGGEISFRWNNDPGTEPSSDEKKTFQYIVMHYTYLDSRIEAGNIFRSLYSFLHPRHQLNATLSGSLPLTIDFTASATHKIKLDGTNYTIVDAKFSRIFSRINVFIQGTNLLNKAYEEITGVPLPGRWLWAGAEFRIL